MRRQGLLDSPRGCGTSDHLCWSFADDDEFLAAASIWAIDGFGLGQRVVYLADRDPAALRADLRPAMDVDTLIDVGALTIVSLRGGYPGGGPVVAATQLDFYRQLTDRAIADGFAGIRVVADGTELVRNPAHVDAMVRWEQTADRYMAKAPMSAMCAYDRRALPMATLAEVCAVHPLRHDPSEATPFSVHALPLGWAIAGDLESYSRDQLDRILRQVTAGSEARVVLDVRAVSHVSAACAAVLHRLALRMAQRGRTLELLDPSPVFRRVWDALDFDRGPAELS